MNENLYSIKEFVDGIYADYSSVTAYKFFADDKTVESRTYKQLRNDTYGLASYLIKKGYSQSHIAILGGTSYEWIVSFLAVILSGNIVIPIDKMLHEEEMMYLFEAGDVEHIVYDSELLKLYPWMDVGNMRKVEPRRKELIQGDSIIDRPPEGMDKGIEAIITELIWGAIKGTISPEEAVKYAADHSEEVNV